MGLCFVLFCFGCCSFVSQFCWKGISVLLPGGGDDGDCRSEGRGVRLAECEASILRAESGKKSGGGDSLFSRWTPLQSACSLLCLLSLSLLSLSLPPLQRVNL